MPFGIGTAGYVITLRKRNTHTLQGVQGIFNHWTAPDNYWYGTAVPGRTRCGAPEFSISYLKDVVSVHLFFIITCYTCARENVS